MSLKTQKSLLGFRLHKTFTYFLFDSYWLSFNFCLSLLLCNPTGIVSSVIGLKMCVITAGIKK